MEAAETRLTLIFDNPYPHTVFLSQKAGEGSLKHCSTIEPVWTLRKDADRYWCNMVVTLLPLISSWERMTEKNNNTGFLAVLFF
jgi:hypothetical protein